MKHTLFNLLFLIAIVACQQETPVEVPKDDYSGLLNASECVRGEVQVKFRELAEDLEIKATRSGGISTEDVALDEAVARIGAVRMERIFPYAGKFEARTRKAGLHLWYRVVFDEEVAVHTAMKELANVSNVVKVAPVALPKTEALPANYHYNDPYFGNQWFLYNPGTNGMVAGADINIVDAWEIEKGKPEVIVAVVDAPVDIMHEDLKDNLWVNSREYNQSPTMDNDGNGYAGDAHGIFYNDMTGSTAGVNHYMVNYSYFPADHGTHVAGIIAAKNNNGIGVSGIAGGDSPDNGVRIMTCPLGAAESIKYAADNGAVICTNSWSGGNAEVLQEAINYFVEYAGVDENGNQTGPMKGGIVLASAGNEGEEATSHVPASLDNVIAVAALGPDFRKSTFSNYADWVDIAAPGGSDGTGWQIYSTITNNRYMEAVGTSMATPVVAGVAALIVSRFGGVDSGLTPYEVEYRLLNGVKSIDSYNPNYVGKLGAGCVDALAALQMEKINHYPTITPDERAGEQQILSFGQQSDYVFVIGDMDGDELTYTVEDPSGAVTSSRDGNQVTLSFLNRDCVHGDHIVTLTVADSAGLTATTTMSVKLHPEFLPEPEIQTSVVDELVIRAGMTFSGNVTARLYDVSGNLVLEEEVVVSLSEPGKLDLSKVDGGNYTLKLICNNKTITQNIIKL